MMTLSKALDGTDQSASKGPVQLLMPFDADKAKAAQKAWSKYVGKSSPIEKNSIGMEFVLIPPGKFTMGSPATESDRLQNENQVEVRLTKPFYLAKTEVTQKEWRAVMGTTPWKGKDRVREGDNFPAVFVSWDDANAFCEKVAADDKADYRLATEAEWEYACRAGQPTPYSCGDDVFQLMEYAWIDENSKVDGERCLHEVGLKKPNAFGLFDMHGNVWEWCADAYSEKLPGGTDPGVRTGEDRVSRGGCWFAFAEVCRCAMRGRPSPSDRNSFLGFRVVWAERGNE
jgi:formylglycine-generating enzyme required for sulfatase activity